MVVDLAGQVRVILLGRFEHYLFFPEGISPHPALGVYCHPALKPETHLGSIGQLVRGQVDLAEASLPDQSTNGIVSNGSKFLG